jgi:hypothetical protein
MLFVFMSPAEMDFFIGGLRPEEREGKGWGGKDGRRKLLLRIQFRNQLYEG